MKKRLQYKLRGARLRRYAFFSSAKLRREAFVAAFDKAMEGLL